jgi:alpha-1,6-mannosyltransferase
VGYPQHLAFITVMHLSSKTLLLFSVVFYIWLCPYTKVEESFNIQATHDLLFLQNVAELAQKSSTAAAISNHYFKEYLTDFDHLEFPGVVPRTFLGSIFLAVVSMPIKAVLELSKFPKIFSQYFVRLSLGVCSWMSFTLFSDSVSRRFGPRAGSLTCILASLQFHIPFYMSRTLPNTFALIGCLIAYSIWLNGRGLRALLVITVTMMIFRCDLLMLLAPLTLQLLLCREVPFWLTACLGLGAGVFSVSLSVAVDSVFWQR